jgi:hypothetical protein
MDAELRCSVDHIMSSELQATAVLFYFFQCVKLNRHGMDPYYTVLFKNILYTIGGVQRMA